MLPRLLRLHPLTYRRLIRLSKEAEQEGAYRVAKCLQAVVRIPKAGPAAIWPEF